MSWNSQFSQTIRQKLENVQLTTESKKEQQQIITSEQLERLIKTLSINFLSTD